MKNFSAKNAEFETVTINNEAAITSANIGTDPNKIPLNKDLGSLAYQDAVNLDDVSADTLELRAIAAEISDSAVDVFVYDTSRDSDGGAWRKRTQHTSWYNEELNTATRGARREFPAVAVIVAEADKVTIYDGDDPDLGMWMVFEVESQKIMGGSSLTCLAAKNGSLVVGSAGYAMQIKFIIDEGLDWYINSLFIFNGNISQRNVALGFEQIASYGLVHQSVNDIAMTILPNAPIDQNTGLPVPTIAVATNGGVSVIKDDGTVVNITVSNGTFSYAKNVNFTTSNDFITVIGGSSSHDYIFVFDGIPNSDNVMTIDSRIGSSQDARSMFRKNYIADSTVFDGFTIGNGGSQSQMIQTIQGDRFVCGNNYDGLTIIDDNNLGFQKKDLVYISSKYNTGWMPGDIKLATLSDTTVENIGVNSDELVTNGGFLADSDWTKGAGWTISGGVALKTGSDNTSILQDVNTIAGKKYVVSFQIVSGTVNSGAKLFVGGDLVAENFKDPQTVSVYFVATDNSTQIGINGGSFDGGSIDNISVRATTELITNGDFSRDATAANFSTTYTDWTVNNAVLSVTGGKLRVDDSAGAGAWSSAVQEINLVPGKQYTLSMNTTDVGGGSSYHVGIDSSSDGTVTDDRLAVGITKYGSYSITFTATTANYLFIGVGGDGVVDFDNISIRPAVDDRSVNNNGLQIIGEIDKTPVAPGADLVAYSGFSANNYLVQPYNQDLDFGTGDFCVMGWFNTQQTSSNAYDDLLSIGDIGTAGYGAWSNGGLLIQNRTYNNRLLIYLSTPSGDTNISLPQPSYTPNTWNHFVIKREAGLVSVFLNATQEGVPVEYNFNFARNNNPDWKFSIGYSGDNYVYPANNSKLALFRISATAPTPDQIAKIYRDEKVLFQDGAQATLYGTSDAVTALAYDDSNQLLHVGTASGRSDFRGLVRVNNTTTAISNSISAAEGTIIQN